MVFSYFFSTGILEVMWKNNLKELYRDPNDFNEVLNCSTYWISVISTLVAVLVSGSLIRRFPNAIIAALTPALLLFPLASWTLFSMGVSSIFLQLSALMGLIYYCMNRITKFTFFDLSKELACVPLSIPQQTKAKAALDGVLPKFGKLTESIYLQGVVFLFGSFQAANTLVLLSLLFLHAVWLYSILFSNSRYLTYSDSAVEISLPNSSSSIALTMNSSQFKRSIRNRTVIDQSSSENC